MSKQAKQFDPIPWALGILTVSVIILGSQKQDLMEENKQLKAQLVEQVETVDQTSCK